MNYFPYLANFKNDIAFSNPFSLQYDYGYTYFMPNQFDLIQLQLKSGFQGIHNEIIQKKEQSVCQEPQNLFFRKVLDSSKEQQAPITQTVNVFNIQIQKNFIKETKEKKVFKQKQGRNMISNLFRQALKCMLVEKERTTEMIEKICSKHKFEINARDFLENISKKLKNLKNYVRVGQIELFLKGKQSGKSKQYACVLRILVHRFLREEVIPCLCNNPKVQSNNRLIHILERRTFQELISL